MLPATESLRAPFPSADLVRRCGLLLVLASSGLISAPILADAVVVTQAMSAPTIAEVFIESDSIRVELEIGIGDLFAFRNLLPDPLYDRLELAPEPLEERLPRFFEEDLVLQLDEGPPLLARIEAIEGRPRIKRDPITGAALPVDEESETVLFVTLLYPIEDLAETLTLEPPRGKSGIAAATIGLMVYHRGLPVMDFRYLGARERLWLDWDDPWYSRFENRNLRRQYDAPMTAFLYVEPWEVRKEIVLRPRDLETWVDLGLQGNERIPVAAQAELKKRVAQFLSTRNPVTIDGEAVAGELDRIHFIYKNLRTSGVIDPPRDLDTISATLGVIFVYPTEGLPSAVSMKWELFSDRIQRVPAVATDEAGGLPSILEEEYPVLEWQNFLRNPTIPGMIEIAPPPPARRAWLILGATVALAGLIWLGLRRGRGPQGEGKRPAWVLLLAVGLLTLAGAAGIQAVRSAALADDEVEKILAGLLRNVYRAFDYREESRIYDTLEQSVAGDLLTKIYLETRQSLELANQGGARARVKQIEMVQSSPQKLRGSRGFVSSCIWNVSGSVGHWGHVHQRTNQYHARVVVEAVAGSWKITDLELLQEERL